MAVDDLFTYDPMIAGTKGLLFIGTKILVYRRDTNTGLFPLYLDLPGGGAEPGETPFENFQRELREEFGLPITRREITYAERYPAQYNPGKYGYFLAAHLSTNAVEQIVFGNEGISWELMDIDEFMGRDDAWPVFRERIAEYRRQHLKVA